MSRPLKYAIVAVAVLAVIGGAVGYWLAGNRTFELRGTVTLDSEWSPGTGETCIGKMDHEDIKAGTQIVVTDGSGTTIALGNLGPGAQIHPGMDCAFPFEIDVPAGRGIYGLSVPGRGEPIQISESEAGSGNVRLVLARVD